MRKGRPLENTEKSPTSEVQVKAPTEVKATEKALLKAIAPSK